MTVKPPAYVSMLEPSLAMRKTEALPWKNGKPVSKPRQGAATGALIAPAIDLMIAVVGFAALLTRERRG